MISGPVLPRTRAGLGELIECQLDAIESGMRAVERDLELQPGCCVDALAGDAAGRPVLVFTLDNEAWRDLPVRLLEARQWIASGAPLLARFVPVDGLDYDLEPRVLVLGFDIPPSLLQQLAELRGEIEVFQVRSVQIRGETRVGAIPMLGGVAGAEDTFQPPSGVKHLARTLSVRFLDLVRRLDPSMRVKGDRYSRRFSVSGSELADLRLAAGSLRVHVPGKFSGALRSKADCTAALDHVMRRYLDIHGTGGPTAAVPPVGAQAPGGDTRPSIDPSLSLDRMRQVVDSTHLSSEEYSGLGESGSDDD